MIVTVCRIDEEGIYRDVAIDPTLISADSAVGGSSGAEDIIRLDQRWAPTRKDESAPERRLPARADDEVINKQGLRLKSLGQDGRPLRAVIVSDCVVDE